MVAPSGDQTAWASQVLVVFAVLRHGSAGWLVPAVDIVDEYIAAGVIYQRATIRRPGRSSETGLVESELAPVSPVRHPFGKS